MILCLNCVIVSFVCLHVELPHHMKPNGLGTGSCIYLQNRFRLIWTHNLLSSVHTKSRITRVEERYSSWFGTKHDDILQGNCYSETTMKSLVSGTSRTVFSVCDAPVQ